MERALAASVLVVGLAVFAGGDVRGAQTDPFLLTVTTGTVSCGDFNTANGARYATYQWWLLGFVSGAGHVRKNINLPMASIDASAALEWTANYCQKKPLDTLAAAAIALVAELGSMRPAN